MAFLSQKNNLQDELTIEESIFASGNEILHIIEQYEKALEMYSNVVKNNDGSNREIALDSVKRRIEKIKQMI